MSEKVEIRAIVMAPNDNVATALADLGAGEKVKAKRGREIFETEIMNQIPFGHKYAFNMIRKGDSIIKYGEVIGVATEDIEIGELVHVHNIVSLRGRGDNIRRQGDYGDQH
jgi:altronate dehydratase small subunit